MIYVGNDVVDLRDPRVVGKAADARFLKRVCTETERAAIKGSATPDIELWRIWAAKEATYKVVSKMRGMPPTFVHDAFEVSLDPPGSRAVDWAHRQATDEQTPNPDAELTTVRSGTVSFESEIVVVVVESGPDTLHAVAWSARAGETPTAAEVEATLARRVVPLDATGAIWADPREELELRLSELELDAVHSRSSAAVRVGARAHLAQALALDEGSLQIVCGPGRIGRRPPRVLIDGEARDADVSLSHHGGWIAWALTTGRSGGS